MKTHDEWIGCPCYGNAGIFLEGLLSTRMWPREFDFYSAKAKEGR